MWSFNGLYLLRYSILLARPHSFTASSEWATGPHGNQRFRLRCQSYYEYSTVQYRWALSSLAPILGANKTACDPVGCFLCCDRNVFGYTWYGANLNFDWRRSRYLVAGRCCICDELLDWASCWCQDEADCLAPIGYRRNCSFSYCHFFYCAGFNRDVC